MSEKNSRIKKPTTSVEENLSSQYIPSGKLGNLPITNTLKAEMEKKANKTKENIDKFHELLIKEYKFIEAVGVIPAQASEKIEEEFEISEEDAKRKLIHLLVIIPEKKYKEIGKIKLNAIKLAKKCEDKLWVHIMTPVDIWNLGLDSKFDLFEALAMSFPLTDKGILGAIRVAMVHRTLVLKKFEKYVTSYVMNGSLVRGEAKKTSDVDVGIIIDDTDVKRMAPLEIKEKLRAIIMQYIQEATAIAGVKNILNVQVWLMTEFWEAVKDAHPVMFTFIRDGVPLYDRGVFLPWKSLLRRGKIKPSSEAIDMFMSSGNRMKEYIDRRMMDIVMHDIFMGVSTPTQGLLMLYGLAPTTVQETVKEFKRVFYDKEKMVEKKYVDILEEVMIKYYKGYEHGKVKTVTGIELDRLIKNALDYYERLKDLRIQIEKRVREKAIEEIYKNTFEMVGSFLKKKTEKEIISEFNKKIINEGKCPPRFLENLKFIAKVKKNLLNKTQENKNKKLAISGKQMSDVDKARSLSVEIIQYMTEYSQRKEFASMDRTRFILKGKNKSGEVFFLKNTFIVEGEKISKLISKKLVESNIEELRKQLSESKKESKIDLSALEILKKSFGDFDLVY